MADARKASDETGKSRAQRIRLDYYRHRGPLYWWRWGLAGIVLLLAGGYVAIATLGNRPAKHLSTGPLALAHASFEQNCEKCHQPLSPLARDAWLPNPQQAIATLERACRSCHSVDGHQHARLSAAGARLDSQCSRCHSDHQGREHSLVSRNDDAACVQCHADLETVRSPDSVALVSRGIQSFTAASHGEFKSLAKDTGRVRFDHAQHLQAGQVEPGQRGGFRLDMLAPADIDRYRQQGQSEDELVRLNCASCHTFEGASKHATNAADAELGRYAAPIRFDRHCAACHSLTYRGQGADHLPLPHAAPWEEIGALLGAKTAAGRLQGEIRMPRDAVRKPVPGTAGDTAEKAAPAARVFDGEIERAIESVRSRCLQCHTETDVTSAALAAAAKDDEPMIPSRWLRRGLFDHAAHPGLHCAICHPGTYAELPEGPLESFAGLESSGIGGTRDAPGAPADNHRVMIRGVGSCTPCHRGVDAALPQTLDELTAGGLLGTTSSWAPSSCTTCHRYHWDQPQPSMVVAP